MSLSLRTPVPSPRRVVSALPLPVHRRLCAKHFQRHRPTTTTTTTASLWSLSDDITSALHTGTTIAIVLGVSLSALPILTGDAKENNERRYLQPNTEEGADNIRWGVMSVLSFFPFLNPMVRTFVYYLDHTPSTISHTHIPPPTHPKGMGFWGIGR